MPKGALLRGASEGLRATVCTSGRPDMLPFPTILLLVEFRLLVPLLSKALPLMLLDYTPSSRDTTLPPLRREHPQSASLLPYPNTLRSRNPNSKPSYTLHPIALLAAFREMRNVEPAKKPAKPRDCISV